MLGSRLLWVALLATSAAGAAPRSARLRYTRGPGAEACPDQRSVQSAIEARLGYQPFREDAALTIEAELAREGEFLAGWIRLHQTSGEPRGARRIRAAPGDCAELAAAMELAISIAIDPLAASSAAPPAVEPSPAPSPPEPPAPPPAPAEPAGTPLSALASVGATVSFGAAPGPGAGLVAEARLKGALFSLGLEGRLDLPLFAQRLPKGSARSSVIAAALSPCLHRGAGSACLVLLGGALRATGEGLADSRSVTAPHLLAGVKAGYQLPLGEAAFVGFHGLLLARLVSITLLVDDAPAWTSPPLSAGLGLGLGFLFL